MNYSQELEKKQEYNPTKKEESLIKKLIRREKKKKKEYISKGVIKKKIKNSKSYFNIDKVEDGIIYLKTGEVAKVISVEAVDLSLTSNNQKLSFFNQLKFLYQIKNLDLRIYKLDDRINLNANKDYYNDLIKKFETNENKTKFLSERLNLFELLEVDNLTVTSKYYFVVISKNTILLTKAVGEIEQSCCNINPRLPIECLNNKLEIYQFLINLYLSNSSLEQLLWCNLIDLITPYYISERSTFIKFDELEVQMVSIKNIPPFLDELFFEEVFNVPNTRCCIHIKDTINTDNLVNILDSSYQFLLSDRNSTRKLSNATEMDIEKENFQALMTQIKSGDEKIKEVNFIIAITGSRKEREDKLKELKKIADMYKIKLDIPRVRQYEMWQNFDITTNVTEDYSLYLPTLTLGAGFPLTVTNFNDYSGYIMGLDIHTALPIVFDIFNKSDKSRPSHNLAIISSTGGGKSFTLKKMIVNEINRGTKIFIFDAEGEYEKLVKRNNGEYIDLYSTSGGIINPLQVRFLPNEAEEKSRVNTMSSNDFPLSKHLGFLETFLKCAFEKISEKEIVVLLDMIERLYKEYGITKTTSISQLEKLSNKDYPIFNDLIKFVPRYKEIIVNPEKIKIIDQLEILLERFAVGTDAMLFNGYTTVSLDNDLIAFNLKDLMYSGNKRIINTQIVNLLTYLNNIIVSNKILNDGLKNSDDHKKIAIVVDEFHLYIKNNNSDVILTFEQIARRIRKYDGAFIPATQSIRDFIGESEVIRSATAIFNNCQYQLVGMLKEDDLSSYLKLFYENPLTDTQKEFLLRAVQGEFLLTINSKKRLRLWVRASDMERTLMGEEL